ncbi:MAG: alkaline phosphatase family protein [Pirellulales bacterium]|nr:alkaline phosphatase family protein [Pirellulales bacterium]
MPDIVVLLSLPGLRSQDLSSMPVLQRLAATGEVSQLVPSFPAVTCPVQANMTTGQLPHEHGVIGNGFYYRERHEFELWTAWNECIERPQIWDVLHKERPGVTSAIWFPLHSKGAGADYICTPAPIHNPDGSESLWCYTRPTELYGQLRDQLEHFPLWHFWGPQANVASSRWIAESAVIAAQRFQPHFFYIYLPHLDYAAQKHGPDSPEAQQALGELDAVLAPLVAGIEAAYSPAQPLWLVASEYAIVPVEHVSYPNRVLRNAGLLRVRDAGAGELIDLATTPAWCLADHQLGHVYVADTADVERVAALFRGQPGIAEVLVGRERGKYDVDHPRSGEVVLISTPQSWQAYYYWLDDARAPAFARLVDIHQKPGYDPVELHLDLTTHSIPLDATLIRGSHGAPARTNEQRGIIISSQRGTLVGHALADTDVFDLVLRQYGI